MKLETRAFAADLQLRGEDQRTLYGVAVPWGQEARIGPRLVETFTRGAFATTDPAEVPLTSTHPKDGSQLPIGRTDELVDQADGLHGAWFVPDTAAGNDVLELVRNRVALMLSIGFVPLPGGDHWTANRTRVERRAALLDHVAVVRAGAPMPAPRCSACAQPTGQQPRCSTWPGCAMGKGGNGFGGLKNAGAWPGYTRARRCIGCRHPIVQGERCPPCARQVRTRAAKRRRRR